MLINAYDAIYDQRGVEMTAIDLMKAGVIKPGARWVYHAGLGGGVVVDKEVIDKGMPKSRIPEATRKRMRKDVKSRVNRYKLNILKYGREIADDLFEQERRMLLKGA